MPMKGSDELFTSMLLQRPSDRSTEMIVGSLDSDRTKVPTGREIFLLRNMVHNIFICIGLR